MVSLYLDLLGLRVNADEEFIELLSLFASHACQDAGYLISPGPCVLQMQCSLLSF